MKKVSFEELINNVESFLRGENDSFEKMELSEEAEEQASKDEKPMIRIDIPKDSLKSKRSRFLFCFSFDEGKTYKWRRPNQEDMEPIGQDYIIDMYLDMPEIEKILADKNIEIYE